MIGKFGLVVAAIVTTVLIVGLALLLWPVSAAPLPDARQDRLIVGARIVDVVAGTVGPPVTVKIRGGSIVAIGAGVRTSGLPLVDGRGAFLVPGFWDMHAHSFRASPQMHFPLWIANGVTNIRDMMDCPGARDSLIACVADKRRWNAEIAAGRLVGPRIVEVASYYFERPDLSPMAARARVLADRKRGLDTIKVYNRLSKATYQATASAARVQGMRVVGHLPKAVPLEDAIGAGQVSFEHARLLPYHCWAQSARWRSGALDGLAPTALTEKVVAGYDPSRCADAFDRLRRAGAWYVPTHVTREEDARAGDPAFSGDLWLAYLDPLSRWAFRDDLAGTEAAYPGPGGRRALRRFFGHGLRLTGDAHRAGVNVLVGTDTVIGGFRYHDEMAHLVRAGLRPAAVLRAATIDAARYAGLAAQSGTVETGKRADLVLLDANPLDDIANTRRIRAVIQDGRLYDRSALDGLLSFVREQASAVHNWAKLLWGFGWSSVNADM